MACLIYAWRLVKYRIVDAELGQLGDPLRLAPDEHGAAVIVRHRGQPVGFFMFDAPAGSVIEGPTITRRASTECAAVVLQLSLRDELTGPAAPVGLPTVTLAICTKDRPDLLARCLGSVLRLRQTSTLREVLVEILVVDNAPSDERCAEVVADMAGVRRVVEPRQGLDFARNRAWQEAKGEFVAFVDDDAMVDAGWLDGFISTWRRHPDAGAFTGLVLPLALETESQIQFERRGGFRRGFSSSRYVGSNRAGDPWYPTGAGVFGAGCNMVIRRDVLRQLDGFDEALDMGAPLPGGGDLDIFYRTVRSNYALVYDPRMLVLHEHRRTSRGLRRQYYTWGLGFLAFSTKIWRTDPTQRAKVIGLLRWWVRDLSGTALRALFVRGNERLSYVVAELWGGVVGVAGTYSRALRRVARIHEESAQ